jgi:Zn-dependent protease with chaperone function
VDFYAYQAAARSRSRYLMLAFILAVALVTLALDAVAFTLLGARETAQPQGPFDYAVQNPGAAVFFSLLIIGVIGLASLYKSFELRGGGAVVARSLGGVRIEADTTDLKLKRLRNIVEEMALASGVPVPEIFVLEHEGAINAFAAGHTPANAAVTVTQGALDHLDRDELQGVIGHEFSHVLNGDMRLNVQLIGWVFGLLVLTLIGRTILQFTPRGRDRRSAGAFIVFAVAMIVLGYLGLLAGRILQAAVSRQRERLADASSVQFTRNPQGLKGALMKIAALSEGSYLTALHTESVAHMLFAPGLERVFATHPPLLKRILELDPHFDPQEIKRLAARGVRESDPPQEVETHAQLQPGSSPVGDPVAHAASAASRFGAASGFAVAIPLQSRSVPGVSATAPASAAPATARSIAAQVGQVESIHIAHAQELRVRLPDVLREFADVPGKARSLVLALLLARDAEVRASQERLLAGSLTPVELAAVQQAAMVARTLDPMLRLPAVLQIFPALRRLPLADRQALLKLVADLLNADHRVDVFEFCLAKLLTTLLTDQMEARAPHGSMTLEDAVQSIHVLFATMAQAGAADDREARAAYETGMQAVLSMRYPPYVSYPDWPRRLEAALPELEALQPFAKQAVIGGLVCTIASDGRLTVEEVELLRTTCALLHCPLPPLLAG